MTLAATQQGEGSTANADAPAPPAPQLLDAYREADLTLRVRQAKICCVLSMLLVPACTGMDYFVYRELVWPMFVARLLCDVALLPCLLLLMSPLGRRYAGILGHAPPGLPAIAICWMIYASEGTWSPYYAGLNIVMVGVILLIPYRTGEVLAMCGFVMASYTIACLAHRFHPPAHALHVSTTRGLITFVNNVYFIVMTAVLAVTACHVNAIRRFTDFRLRHEIDANNRDLAAALKRLQETEVQLVQSEKMNALGKLSAGLLHEVNNPLNFTFMALQMAKEEAADNAELTDTLTDIHQGMERIRTVVSDLRAFAHPTTLNAAEPFKVADALTTALRLTAHELGDIPVEQANLEGATVIGAKTQIVHVLMNMLVNSAQAMREKPTGRPPRITVEAYPSTVGRLEIAVRDNGPGVAAANLPRLLEPFFTTKEPGKGTGLGLSICHTIVKNHGGEIAITTEEGKWTQVAFNLAVASQPPSQQPQPGQQQPAQEPTPLPQAPPAQAA